MGSGEAGARQGGREPAQRRGGLAAAQIGGKGLLPGHLKKLLSHVGADVVNDVAKLAGSRLKESNSDALGRHDYLAATLSRFRLDLDQGEEEQVLLRSRR